MTTAEAMPPIMQDDEFSKIDTFPSTALFDQYDGITEAVVLPTLKDDSYENLYPSIA